LISPWVVIALNSGAGSPIRGIETASTFCTSSIVLKTIYLINTYLTIQSALTGKNSTSISSIVNGIGFTAVD
jgi:hypothetical protein